MGRDLPRVTEPGHGHHQAPCPWLHYLRQAFALTCPLTMSLHFRWLEAGLPSHAIHVSEPTTQAWALRQHEMNLWKLLSDREAINQRPALLQCCTGAVGTSPVPGALG